MKKPNKKIQKLISKLPQDFVKYLRTTPMAKKYPELKNKDEAEQLRRDEKNGLYPELHDDAN